MKRSTLLIPVLAIATQTAAFADGGTVQLRKDTGSLLITVFTSPAPLSVGPADISVLLQNRDGLEPVLDANVSLALGQGDANTGMRTPATREQARNKLLYAAPVVLPAAGKWQIAVTVEHGGERMTVSGILEVAPAPGKAASYAGYIAFPPVMIALFIVRERLVHRKSRG